MHKKPNPSAAFRYPQKFGACLLQRGVLDAELARDSIEFRILEWQGADIDGGLKFDAGKHAWRGKESQWVNVCLINGRNAQLAVRFQKRRRNASIAGCDIQHLRISMQLQRELFPKPGDDEDILGGLSGDAAIETVGLPV